MQENSEAAYIKKQEEECAEYEALCKHCGTCCGATGSDPCANLEKRSDGKYNCKAYAARIGRQKTVSGNEFTCIPIRMVLLYHVPHPDCGYVTRA